MVLHTDGRTKGLITFASLLLTGWEVNSNPNIYIATVIWSAAPATLFLTWVPPRYVLRFLLIFRFPPMWALKYGNGIIAIILFLSVFLWFALNRWPTEGEKEIALETGYKHNIGRLIPAEDPLPTAECVDSNKKGFYLFAGSNTFYHSSFPISAINIRNEDIIKLDENDGRLLISAKLYGRNGLLARIDNNRFWTTRFGQGIFDDFRPDAHTYVIYDNWGDEILYIRYLRKNAIRIRGAFFPKYTGLPLIVTDTATKVGSQALGGMTNVCIFDAKADVVVR